MAEELCSIKDKSRLSELISTRNLSLRKARHLARDNDVDFVDNISSNEVALETEKLGRILDKLIISLRSSMSNFVATMDKAEDNWIFYEMLMQHRNMLHSEIDLLIKQKKKLSIYKIK